MRTARTGLERRADALTPGDWIDWEDGSYRVAGYERDGEMVNLVLEDLTNPRRSGRVRVDYRERFPLLHRACEACGHDFDTHRVQDGGCDRCDCQGYEDEAGA